MVSSFPALPNVPRLEVKPPPATAAQALLCLGWKGQMFDPKMSRGCLIMEMQKQHTREKQKESEPSSDSSGADQPQVFRLSAQTRDKFGEELCKTNNPMSGAVWSMKYELFNLDIVFSEK